MGLSVPDGAPSASREIDPYASAVLAERWPGVPNLGDIVRARNDLRPDSGTHTNRRHRQRRRCGIGSGIETDGTVLTLWTGGFPCQDLSVAGKRGRARRSPHGLAFAFLDLVERHRPPAILLENVPGLLSS